MRMRPYTAVVFPAPSGLVAGRFQALHRQRRGMGERRALRRRDAGPLEPRLQADRLRQMARTSRAVVEVSEGSRAWSTRIRRVPTRTRSTRPAARARVAEASEALGHERHLGPTAVPAATTVARSGDRQGADDPDARRGAWLPLRRTGIVTAAATASRMMSVPTRKVRPLTRSRTSRRATRPTSPPSLSSTAPTRPGPAPARREPTPRRRARAGGCAAAWRTRTTRTTTDHAGARIDDLHTSASRKTSDSRWRSNPNCSTGPAGMAAARTAWGSVPSSSTRRTAPPSTREMCTPGTGPGPCPGEVAVDLDHESSAPARGELLHRPRCHQAAVVDDGHRLAQVFDEVDLVAREQHAAPGGSLVDEHGAHGVDPDGVEPRQGLVEHEELGLVDQGGGQLHPLLVAERQGLELVGGTVGHAELLEPTQRRAPGRAGGHAVQSGQVLDLLDDHHARVEAPLLGHVAEALTILGGHRGAVPPHDAGVEPDQLEHGSHGRGLARPVGTEEPEDLPGGHRERQLVEGDDVAEAAGEPVELQHRAWLSHRLRRWADTP